MLSSTVLHIQQLVGGLNGWIANALNGNTLVAGAATASLLASLAYVARGMPRTLWRYLKRHIVFTYYIEYDYDEQRTMIQIISEKFEHELQKRVSGKRASARLTTRKKRLTETLADGGFFFWDDNALIWVSRSQENQNKENSKPRRIVTLSLTTLRFHRQKLLGMLSQSARDYTVPGIYQLVAPSWGGGTPGAYRQRNFTSLPPLAIEQNVKEQIDTLIAEFLRKREAKNRTDTPHKLVFMLYGEPGTGKSALGEYIAFKLKTSLFVINGLSQKGHNDLGLSDSVFAARDNIAEGEIPVIMLDDFDTYMTGLRRRETEDPAEARAARSSENVQLGQMLASLQSPVEITDCVIIFTTNHLNKIDPAMYRPGRVSALIEVGRMSPKAIMQYYEQVYGQKWPAHTPIERALRACDVSAFFSVNEDNPEGFVRAITANEISADEAFRSKADVASV